MTGLGKTIAGLARHRQEWSRRIAEAAARAEVRSPAGGGRAEKGRLREVTGFGSNPGALRMLAYAPPVLADPPGLVVVLHGCTQSAAAYDLGAGWSTLADRYGFCLLFPEQTPANNPKTCFNWFQPGDSARDRGEAVSIRQMVERMILDHGIDRGQVFVTGLSAGGAMTSVMLAAYPEVFAAGAIVAGLPYGCAANVQEAFESMFQGRTRPAREWGDLVRAASSHRGPWPRVSVWHGTADATVKPMNAGEVVKQWTDVHGLPGAPTRRETVDGYPRQVWCGPDGEVLVEEYAITGMAHGTPLATGEGDDRFGAAGPFLLDVGISSSYHIAKFFGLTGRRVEAARPATSGAIALPDRSGSPAPAPAPREPAARPAASRPAEPRREPPPRPERRSGQGRQGSMDVGAVITKALRAAGLMR